MDGAFSFEIKYVFVCDGPILRSELEFKIWFVFVSGIMLIICSNTYAGDVEALPNNDDREWIYYNQVYYNTGRHPLYLNINEPRNRLTRRYRTQTFF